tara:strand:+ start:1202 stop:2086 length:885 start_codon:yes stop_codon:yes gene_type:complete
MNIIDAHHHLWDIDLHDYPWLIKDRKNPLSKNYLTEDFNKDIGDLDVIKSVHIQAEMNHNDPLQETNWLQSISETEKSQGLPNAIVGYADLKSGNLDSTLNEHLKYANFRGIRQILNFSNSNTELNQYEGINANLLKDEKWKEGFSKLNSLNLSFDLQVWPCQLEDSDNLAKEFGETLIILNHTGCPLLNGNKEDQIEWYEGMKLLASNENVVVKISGLFMRGDLEDPHLKEVIENTINLFGTSRSLFASNFPVDSLKITYRKLWNFFIENTLKYSEAEKEKMFYQNAEKYYRI